MTPLIDEQYVRTLAATLDALPEQVVRYRLPDLTIVYCNARLGDLVPPRARTRCSAARSTSSCRTTARPACTRNSPSSVPTIPSSPTRSLRDAPNAPGQWVEWVDRYLPEPDGDEVLAVGRDVTARHIAEASLAESEARFRDLADESADVVWHFVLEPYPHFDYISPSVENILGYPAVVLPRRLRREFLDILDRRGPSTHRPRLRRRATCPSVPTSTCVTPTARSSSARCRFDCVRRRSAGVGRDVTELRRLQESLDALALRDPLTGLANRRLFKELLDADLARTQRNGLPLAVAYLDLDDFKSVNDSHGHDAGDIVLCETARRLLAVVRGADIVARLGGDEFVIVYEPNDPSADNLVQRLEQALSEPIRVRIGVIRGLPSQHRRRRHSHHRI